MHWILIAITLTSCIWNQPKISQRYLKKEQCVKIINGVYYYVDDCKYWGHVPSSDGQAILPP